jgi:2'-5' RNA ligase
MLSISAKPRAIWSATASMAPRAAMGAAFRLGHDGVDQFQFRRSWAVILSAVAASCALSALRHRIEAAPSGEITE